MQILPGSSPARSFLPQLRKRPRWGGLLGHRIQHASDRAARFGLAERACLVVGDLAATGLPEASADACSPHRRLAHGCRPAAAGREVRRILRPGRRLVLTGRWPPVSLRLDPQMLTTRSRDELTPRGPGRNGCRE